MYNRYILVLPLGPSTGSSPSIAGKASTVNLVKKSGSDNLYTMQFCIWSLENSFSFIGGASEM
jgi:hypothetical protein